MRRTIIGATLAAASVVAGGALVAELALPGSAASHKTAVSTYDAASGPSGSSGISGSNVPSASDPLHATLQGLVTKGVITQAQADAVEQALRAAGDGDFHRGPFGPRGHGGPGFRLDTVAKALGIDAAALQTAIQNGSTIADVAKAHNVDLQKVIDALVADTKTKLDAEVKEGHLTQAQEDQALKDAAIRFGNFVNNKLPAFGHRGGPFGGGEFRGGPFGDGGFGPGSGSPPATSNA